MRAIIIRYIMFTENAATADNDFKRRKNMFDVKKMVAEVLAKTEIKNIAFVGCGGSLVCFHAPYYYVTREAENLNAYYCNAHEFTNDPPKGVGKNSLVICSSRRGTTKQTVDAAKKAKELGATVVGLQFGENETPLKNTCDYTISFKDVGDNGAVYEEGKGATALKIAYELVHQLEGNDAVYEKMVEGMAKMNELLPKAVVAIVPEAVKFSMDYYKDEIIYTLGSGTAWGAAHGESICIFMEMQWINSCVIHPDEFFNGPFEITEPETAYLFLKSTGKTRELDERALRFLEKFNHHCTVIDGADYGMCELGEVSTYFDQGFYDGVLGVYNDLLNPFPLLS